MTRINLIAPAELTDQHLIAEYREIRHVGPSLQRSLKSKKGFDRSRIPSKFTLNAGHVLFFYNKGKYLHNRFNKLVEEMKRRGMKPNSEITFNEQLFPSEFYNDWVPSEEDKNITKERIKLRISQKPGWYRRYGKVVD